MSVIKDGIGDRDIPGATASQLVDVSQHIHILLVSNIDASADHHADCVR